MFKLGRSRAVASALNASKVLFYLSIIKSSLPCLIGFDAIYKIRELLLTLYLQFVAPAARFPGVQQRRALSIHEYLSADLLRQVRFYLLKPPF